MNRVFVFLDLGPIRALLWTAAGMALFLYLCAQALFYRMRDDVAPF